MEMRVEPLCSTCLATCACARLLYALGVKSRAISLSQLSFPATLRYFFGWMRFVCFSAVDFLKAAQQSFSEAKPSDEVRGAEAETSMLPKDDALKSQILSML